MFSWIFGIDKGWREINLGADIKIPTIYKFIIKYITPLMLLFVFLGSIFTPQGNDWTGNFSSLFSGNGWALDNASIIKQITHAGIKEKIAMTTDINLIAELKDKIFYANLARIIF